MQVDGPEVSFSGEACEWCRWQTISLESARWRCFASASEGNWFSQVTLILNFCQLFLMAVSQVSKESDVRSDRCFHLSIYEASFKEWSCTVCKAPVHSPADCRSSLLSVYLQCGV